jgi:hypothetical protein
MVGLSGPILGVFAGDCSDPIRAACRHQYRNGRCHDHEFELRPSRLELRHDVTTASITPIYSLQPQRKARRKPMRLTLAGTLRCASSALGHARLIEPKTNATRHRRALIRDAAHVAPTIICKEDRTMRVRKFVGIVMLSFASAAYVGAAHAQGLTREQVRQQLIEAQQNGLSFVTDASYPDVSPVYQHQVDKMRATHAHDSGVGAQASGSTESGASKASPQMPMQTRPTPHDDCVGPVSFCNIYFGS